MTDTDQIILIVVGVFVLIYRYYTLKLYQSKEKE